jgi:hypothetical protein
MVHHEEDKPWTNYTVVTDCVYFIMPLFGGKKKEIDFSCHFQLSLKLLIHANIPKSSILATLVIWGY